MEKAKFTDRIKAKTDWVISKFIGEPGKYSTESGEIVVFFKPKMGEDLYPRSVSDTVQLNFFQKDIIHKYNSEGNLVYRRRGKDFPKTSDEPVGQSVAPWTLLD